MASWAIGIFWGYPRSLESWFPLMGIPMGVRSVSYLVVTCSYFLLHHFFSDTTQIFHPQLKPTTVFFAPPFLGLLKVREVGVGQFWVGSCPQFACLCVGARASNKHPPRSSVRVFGGKVTHQTPGLKVVFNGAGIVY